MGDNVELPVLAKDPNTENPEDHLTYHLEPFTGINPDDLNGGDDFATDVDFFDIDPVTAQITVAKKLDFDANPIEASADGKYTVIVRATDPSGEDNDATVTITATRANDAPVIKGEDKGAAAELEVNELDSDDFDGDGEPDAPYAPMTGDIMDGVIMGNVFLAVDDDEVDQATWTLEGADASVFVLNKKDGPDEPRELLFNPDKAPPDYEAPTDANGDSVYKVTLVATDSSDAEARKPVTVFVLNQQEAGKVVLYNGAAPLGEESPVAGMTLTAKVEDPDGGVTIVTWQWFKSTTQVGDYDPIIGETTDTYTPTDGDAEDAVFLLARATYIDTLTEGDDRVSTPNVDERVQHEHTTPVTPKDPGDAHEGDMRLYEAEATSANAVRREVTTTPDPVGPGGPGDPGPGGPGPVSPGRPDPIVCNREGISLEVVENAETGSFVGPVKSLAEICTGGEGELTYGLPSTADNWAFSVMSGVGSPGSPGIPMITVGSRPRAGIVNEDPGLNYEVKPQYDVVIGVTDTASPPQTSSFPVTVNLKNLNEKPFFSSASLANYGRDYLEGRTNPVVATYAATEPDGDPIDWYVYGTDAHHFTIAGGELSFVNVPDFEDPQDGFDANNDGDFDDIEDDPDTVQVERDMPRDNVYNITVRATERTAIGGGPSLSADLDVAVRVIDRDEPGTVMLQWLQPEVGTPIGVVLTDPDDDAATGTISSYAWYRSKVANPDPTPDIGDPIRFPAQWENVSVYDSSYTPVGDTDEDTKVLDEGRFLLALVTYGGGTQAAGISRYTVREDVLPDDNGSPDFRRNERTIDDVLETTPVGGAVGTVIVDEEPDNDILTYELVPLGGDELTKALNRGARDETNPNNADVDFFEIDPATGVVTVKKMLSYEADDGRTYGTGADALTAGEYKFIVRATDPSGEGVDTDVTPNVYRDSDEITITVMADKDNEAPKVTEGQADLKIYEANSREKDDGEPNYFINLGYRPVDDNNLELEFDPANLNLYKDQDADAPDNPSWTLDGPDMKWFALGTPDDGIGRRLVFGQDPEHPDGQDFEPDFEDPKDINRDNVYEVTVVVHDSSEVAGRQNVRVEVMNVREVEKLTLTPPQPYVPGDQSTVTAELTDYDGVISYTYWQWYWTDTDTDLHFATVDDPVTVVDDRDLVDLELPTQGRIDRANMGTYTANEDDIGRYLHALVEYRDGWSSVDNPAASSPEDERNIYPSNNYVTEEAFAYDSDEMLTARTENAVQTDPTDPTGPGVEPGPDPDPIDPIDPPTTPANPFTEAFETMVKENTPGSGYVGEPTTLFVGLDYELSGPDAGYFVLADDVRDVYATDNQQPKPGQLAVALSPTVAQLDYEGSQNSYTFQMTATRPDGRQHIINVEIVVEDVNEAPSAPEREGTGLHIRGWVTVRHAEDQGPDTEVATYTAVGPEAASTTWDLSGDDAGDFSINPTSGVLTFTVAPDYEMPADMDMDNMYMVTVTATRGGDTATKDVTVEVTNEDEMGTVAFSPEQPRVGMAVTATLMDDDGIVPGSLTWQWASSDAMDGTFTDIAGATMESYTPRAAMEDDPATMDVDETDAGDVGMYLRATAMYYDGHGADKMAYEMTDSAVTSTPADMCIEELDSLPSTTDGMWASDCASEARSGSYARYYTFTLDSAYPGGD